MADEMLLEELKEKRETDSRKELMRMRNGFRREIAKLEAELKRPDQLPGQLREWAQAEIRKLEERIKETTLAVHDIERTRAVKEGRASGPSC